MLRASRLREAEVGQPAPVTPSPELDVPAAN
jgi:hypothetical protein